MSFQLKLNIQIGRTYLELLLKESFTFFNCCGVSEKKNADFYYIQNKEISFFSNCLTIKNENNIEHSNKFKIINDEKNNDNNIIDNLITGSNPIDIEEHNNCSIRLKEGNNKQQENNIIDDIENLIYENEQNNNNDNKREDIIGENIINNSENKVDNNIESINLLEINNDFS